MVFRGRESMVSRLQCTVVEVSGKYQGKGPCSGLGRSVALGYSLKIVMVTGLSVVQLI